MTRIPTSALIAFLLILAAASASFAQTAPTPPMKHGEDQGFHHSFGNAETWAKEFDDPARDAGRNPIKYWMLYSSLQRPALQMWVLALAISAYGLPDACPTARSSPWTSNRTC